MNTTLSLRPSSLPAPSHPSMGSERAEGRPTRHIHRERDFGVGYGNSSGYANSPRYSSNWAAPRFKFG